MVELRAMYKRVIVDGGMVLRIQEMHRMGRENPPIVMSAVAFALLFGTVWFATIAVSMQLWLSGQKRMMSTVTREPTPVVVAATAADALHHHHHGPLNVHSGVCLRSTISYKSLGILARIRVRL
jgi:hypothetical protein